MLPQQIPLELGAAGYNRELAMDIVKGLPVLVKEKLGVMLGRNHWSRRLKQRAGLRKRC